MPTNVKLKTINTCIKKKTQNIERKNPESTLVQKIK